MNRTISTLAVLGFLLIASAGIQAKPLQLSSIDVVSMEDVRNKRNYELFIKLPEDYEEKGQKKYPVIYYVDALWNVEMLSSASTYLMSEVILVGISWQKNADPELVKQVGEHVSRYRDYSIWASADTKKQEKYQFGQAAKHLDFISEQVIPHIETNYQIDSESRAFFGYSLGGQFGIYALLVEPDIFNYYLLGSASIWKQPELKSLVEQSSKNTAVNIFISHGSKEDELREHVIDFVAYLKERIGKTSSVTYQVIDGDHQSAAPSTVISAINWLNEQVHGSEI